MVSASTLNDLNSTLSALQRSAAELSSGRRILEASDDPYGASQAIDLQSQLDGLSANATGIQDGTNWLQASSVAMGSISQITQRVRELLVQAQNGTNSPSDLKAIGIEVTQLTEAIKQDANTQYAGQYVFGGTATTTAPYAPGAEDTFKGNAEAVARAIAPGATVTVNTDLASVLGNGQASADGKLLDTLRTIAQHLGEATPESKAALAGDMTNLTANMESMTRVQSENGSATQQLQTASARIESLQSSITQALSNTEDANFAKTSIAYSTEQAAYSAALRASASIVQESLLNFLH